MSANGNVTTPRQLPFSIPSSLYYWLKKQKLSVSEKYRIINIVHMAQEQNSRTFFLTKKAFEELVGTSNRRTQKDLLAMLQEQGIIEVLKEDHFQIHFEISPELVEGDNMGTGSVLKPKFEDPKLYDPPLGATMPSRQDSTKEKYNEEISDLLSEVTSKDILEKAGKNDTLRQALYDRVNNVKARVKNYEKRNKAKLTQELANLDSIFRILDTIKVFNPVTESYEEQKNNNKIKVSPRDIVSYFYWRLGVKLKTKIEIMMWPSEINAAKDVLRQLPNKDSTYVHNYVDWVLETKKGVTKLHNIRYYVSQYLQTVDDAQFWKPIWTKYCERLPNSSGFIPPQNDDELECLFAYTFEKTFKTKYVPINSFKRDLSQIKQMKTYLGDNLAKTARFVVWCIEKTLAARNEKPAGPGDLYRFIQDFKDAGSDTSQGAEIVQIDNIMLATPEQKNIIQLQALLKRAETRDNGFELYLSERNMLQKLFKQVTLDKLDAETKQIINKNSSHFVVRDGQVELGETDVCLSVSI